MGGDILIDEEKEEWREGGKDDDESEGKEERRKDVERRAEPLRAVFELHACVRAVAGGHAHCVMCFSRVFARPFFPLPAVLCPILVMLGTLT